MRILLLAPPWFAVPPTSYGGIEQVVALLADGLTDRGHDVTLVASGGSVTKARLETVFTVPPSGQLGNPWHELVHALGGYSRVDEFDVVHDHSGIFGPALGAMLHDRGAAPPIIHTLHGPWHPPVALLYQSLPRTLHLVAISQDQRNRAPDGLQFAGVVHNGIPVEAFGCNLARRGRDGYLAWVGRASRDKGPDTALAVAARLGRPLKMAIKINEPDEHAYWHEVIVPLLDTADVEVVVGADHATKVAIMAGADAQLVPICWHEPFGLVMVEAMACGTPVIAYAAGAAPELIVGGRTGFLVPPGDFDGLCAAVERVDEIDPAECRHWAEERFSGDRMVEDYLRIYKRVAAEGLLAPALS